VGTTTRRPGGEPLEDAAGGEGDDLAIADLAGTRLALAGSHERAQAHMGSAL
jgi:hypothetical protein